MESGSTPQIEDQFKDLNVPKIGDMQIQLEELVQQGTLSPEQAQAILMDSSAWENVSSDPNLKNAQLEALTALQEIGQSGGLTLSDRAALNKIATEEATANRGAREAILQNAEARGAGGSGMSILAQLQNQQDSATRRSQRDLDVAGLAQERALQALTQAGTTAGNIRSQDFTEQGARADALDAISKFNTANQQNVALTNTAANNEAQARNLAAKQAVADANTATRNNQQMHNKNLIQQDFDNEIKKRGGSTQVQQANAQAQGQNSQNQANATNQTIGTGLTAAAMFMSDEREKEEIEEFNPSDFLDSITAYKYKYKDPKNGEGRHAGVMAQDLEKTEVGARMVTDTPEGKMVDYNKAGPAMMASMANINKRLKKMEEGEE